MPVDPAAPDDELDGCKAVLDAVEFDDEETAALRPLFPGDLVGPVEWLAEQWNQLFADGAPDPVAGVYDVCKVIDAETGDATPSVAELHAAGARGSGRDVGMLDRLKAGGSNVVEVAGWRTRGAPTLSPGGLTDHHTAGPSTGNAGSLGICTNGRADLAGPLCNIFTARDNTIFLVAAGKANHAGEGGWRGLSGNSRVFGNERENDGRQAWRDDQHVAAARANASLLRGHGIDASMHCEHKEWAPRRKPDAHTVTGDHMRALVRSFLTSPSPPVTIPHPPEVHPVTGSPRVDIAWTPSGLGYIVLFQDGGTAEYGDAPKGLSTHGAQPAGVKATALAIHPSGSGIAVLYEDGQIDTRKAPHYGEPTG